MTDGRKRRDAAGILTFVAPQQMAEEIVRLDAVIERMSRQLAGAKEDAAAWKKLAESSIELARIGASMEEIDRLVSDRSDGKKDPK